MATISTIVRVSAESRVRSPRRIKSPPRISAVMRRYVQNSGSVANPMVVRYFVVPVMSVALVMPVKINNAPIKMRSGSVFHSSLFSKTRNMGDENNEVLKNLSVQSEIEHSFTTFLTEG